VPVQAGTQVVATNGNKAQVISLLGHGHVRFQIGYFDVRHYLLNNEVRVADGSGKLFDLPLRLTIAQAQNEAGFCAEMVGGTISGPKPVRPFFPVFFRCTIHPNDLRARPRPRRRPRSADRQPETWRPPTGSVGYSATPANP